MRNNQNKHGPDVDVGRRYTWLRTPDVLTGLPPPWKATKDRCGPGMKLRTSVPIAIGSGLQIEEERLPIVILLNRKSKIENPKLNRPSSSDVRLPGREWPPGSSISQQRRWRRPRSTIADRCPGESPPGSIGELRINKIDSLSQRKGTIRGCILRGSKRLFSSVKGELCPERREQRTLRKGD